MLRDNIEKIHFPMRRLKRKLGGLLGRSADPVSPAAKEVSYEDRVAQQIAQFADVENLHELPDSAHFWNNAYLLPGLKEVFGADSVESFYAAAVADVRSSGP